MAYSTNAAVRFKGCTIVRTNTTTTVRRIGNGGKAWDMYVPLFEITGTVEKPRGLRPFLTSLEGAKRYVTEQIEARSLWARGPQLPTD